MIKLPNTVPIPAPDPKNKMNNVKYGEFNRLENFQKFEISMENIVIVRW